MVLCEVVKLLIELAGLFYSLPGGGREGCPPRALRRFGELLPGGSSPASSLRPSVRQVPGAGVALARREHPRGLLGISSCLNAEIGNGGVVTAVFLLTCVSEAVEVYVRKALIFPG